MPKTNASPKRPKVKKRLHTAKVKRKSKPTGKTVARPAKKAKSHKMAKKAAIGRVTGFGPR